MRQLIGDPGSCVKQHFIDDVWVAGMTVPFVISTFSENLAVAGVSIDQRTD